jgi:hypothetical protein
MVITIVKGARARSVQHALFNKRDYEVDAMVEVHRYLEGNSQFGKIVVTV